MKTKTKLPVPDEPPTLGNVTMVIMSGTVTPATTRIDPPSSIMRMPSQYGLSDLMRARSEDEELMNRAMSELAAYGLYIVAKTRSAGYSVIENGARGYGAWLYPFGKRSEDGRHPPSSLKPERGAPGVTFLAESVSLIKAVHVAHSAVLRRVKWPGESRPRAYRVMPFATPVYEGRDKSLSTGAITNDIPPELLQDPNDAPI